MVPEARIELARSITPRDFKSEDDYIKKINEISNYSDLITFFISQEVGKC